MVGSMTPPREPPSAARIAEIRGGFDDAAGDIATWARVDGTTPKPWHTDIGDLLAALDYCRDVMVEAAAVAEHSPRRAADALVDCLYRLFPEEAS
mgnify:CR=1 FL=1